jgi:hypothetical protein
VSDRRDLEALRRGFQSLADHTPGECSAEDVAAVWRAVRGDLDAEARRALVARLAAEPALAEAWRIAHALESPETAIAPPVAAPRRSWPAPWLAAAALVILGLSAVLLVPQLRRGEPVLRQPGVYAVESLLGPDTALPREAFELRWTAAPPGSRYRVRVTTEDLRVLVTASDLDRPALRVSADALSSVPAGARVFWQVDVMLPGNARFSSPTFVTRVQ